jgi:signal transduction histidine kinase
VKRASIRVRVTAVATIAVAGVLLLAGILLVRSIRVGVSDRVDAQLRHDVRLVETLSLDGRRVPSAALRNRIAQVVDADGTVVWSSDAAGGSDAAALLGSPLPFAAGSGSHLLSIDDPALGDLRVLATPFPEDGEQWLVIARSEDLVAAAERAVVRALLVGIPVLVAGVGCLVWFGVGRALRPVDDIRAAVAEISARHLDTRVPVPSADDEVARLAVTMNEMLDRLDAAAGRERQLVADVSHELRSPVTSLRALLETRAGSPDPAAHDAEMMASVARLQSLVEQVLDLAAQDAGLPVPARPVDLDDLVMERAAVLRATSQLVVDTSAVSAGQVVGSEEGLRRVVDNLGGNASRHAEHTVRFELREVPGWVQLVVADDGPGIPEADRSRVFERFTRLDDARGRGGAGLGLSIVAGEVARQHGRITVDADPGLGGARFVVDLPRSSPSSD